MSVVVPKVSMLKRKKRRGGSVDLHEKTSYVVPVTPSGLPEQLSSSDANDVLVAAAADVVVTVTVMTVEAEVALPPPVAWATRFSAVFALLASIPVPTASPMTAANNRTMMAHKTNTKMVQPQSLPFFLPLAAAEPVPAAGVE